MAKVRNGMSFLSSGENPTLNIRISASCPSLKGKVLISILIYDSFLRAASPKRFLLLSISRSSLAP